MTREERVERIVASIARPHDPDEMLIELAPACHASRRRDE
jgi:hypothetical protein